MGYVMQLPAWPIPEFLAQVERFPQFLATGCPAAGGESKGHWCSTDVPPWFRGKPVLFLKGLALFFRNSSNSSIYIYIGFFRYEIANVWWHWTANICKYGSSMVKPQRCHGFPVKFWAHSIWGFSAEGWDYGGQSDKESSQECASERRNDAGWNHWNNSCN